MADKSRVNIENRIKPRFRVVSYLSARHERVRSHTQLIRVYPANFRGTTMTRSRKDDRGNAETRVLISPCLYLFLTIERFGHGEFVGRAYVCDRAPL